MNAALFFSAMRIGESGAHIYLTILFHEVLCFGT